MEALLTDYLALLRDNSSELWEGLTVTLQLWATSGVAGFVLAITLALGATQGGPAVRRLVRAYSAALRGTPLLVQMFLLYYGLSQFEWVRASAAWVVLEDALYCGLIALTLNIAAYMAEDIRAGILAVPRGQQEAARAFGMQGFTLLRRIVLPQALRIATPALGNEVVSLLKATALVSTITVFDLTGVARRLSTESYTTDALVLAGVVYGALTLLIAAGVHLLGRLRNRHAA
ncbi:ABC transporter permease subunit [Rhodoferax saidenbachensis]|uniref:Polar amino acid transport system permease protein n=1 Tax=Rhodoferax saidenbachensis TaxID=1484693 RepID=A0ABU1ZMQ3_9BURK|nr:ABC transporter permease subunit [Rhodoferax saidenbachensis]MDR7306236.1 polar amino acid transport system permease protein [Rhodoferax saidenbachensis]